MIEFAFVLFFGLALLPLLVTAGRRPHTTVFYWVAAGAILWVTGVSMELGKSFRPLLILGHALGPVSATLFFLGARRFAHQPVPRWVPPLGAATAVATGLLVVAAGRVPAAALQIAVAFPLMAAAAWAVIENARRPGVAFAEIALGGTLALLALLLPIDLLVLLYVEPVPALAPVWATFAFTIALLTLSSLEQRARRRSYRLTQELRSHANALEVESRTLRALIESAPLGIALADPAGDIRYLNEHGAQLLGIGAAEQWHRKRASHIVRALEPRLSPEHRERLSELAEGHSTDGGPPPRLDFELDAGTQIVSLVSQPVRAEDDRHLGRLWLWQDVTEERRLSERLAQAQRMETVGTLAGGVAHDFNNQLTAILGSIDLLLKGVPGAEQQERALRNVEQAALHCADLTQGLLAFSKRSSTGGTAEVGPVVEDVLSLLRPSLAPGIRISAHVADATGCILAGEDDLRRVVMNLAVNARDAVADQGVIRIEARRLHGTQDERVELAVSDDGAGMEAETRRRIFDPFFSTKETGKGTGLGLSVVYGIAQAHGASIEVETAPSRGTTFRLLWPAASTAVPRSARTAAPAIPRPGATVLLADDDPGVRESTRGMLERAGYRVVEASDGKEAVDRFHENGNEVDLLLLDLAMPGCTGLEALEQIRTLAPHPPAILMTGNLAPFAAALPGEADVLRKPFRAEELLTRVQERLAAASAEA